jgi:hypothetical protein
LFARTLKQCLSEGADWFILSNRSQVNW